MAPRRQGLSETSLALIREGVHKCPNGHPLSTWRSGRSGLYQRNGTFSSEGFRGMKTRPSQFDQEGLGAVLSVDVINLSAVGTKEEPPIERAVGPCKRVHPAPDS